ncbi:hypothetical protein BJ508DRAFT_415645 [Ascobolus immersus RN42]|uniref:Uncharacterized protein n=1 Tax=Ascobolus immersus RN42 TaxID=1160509 RepID=A0A3N4I1G1_ASCIM|nr:hypothetical protein BJ508DRAFT_415645 [Ascobolus immersus RN42]
MFPSNLQTPLFYILLLLNILTLTVTALPTTHQISPRSIPPQNIHCTKNLDNHTPEFLTAPGYHHLIRSPLTSLILSTNTPFTSASPVRRAGNNNAVLYAYQTDAEGKQWDAVFVCAAKDVMIEVGKLMEMDTALEGHCWSRATGFVLGEGFLYGRLHVSMGWEEFGGMFERGEWCKALGL